MSKFLIIAILIGVLVFIIAERVINNSLFAPKRFDRPGFVPIEVDNTIVNRIIKRTLGSVFIGFLLLLIVLFLGMKIKILFILLPISFYLMGQLFLLANHINHTKKQQIWFNPKTNDVLIENKKQGSTIINLYRDVRYVREIKSLQKNRGILFGYVQLIADVGDVHIPFLYRENTYNNFFFDSLRNDFDVKSSAVFYPYV